MAPSPTRRGTLTMTPCTLKVAIERSVCTVLKSAEKSASATFSSTNARPSVTRSTLIGSRARSRASKGDTKARWIA